jgi:hypothetical protein
VFIGGVIILSFESPAKHKDAVAYGDLAELAKCLEFEFATLVTFYSSPVIARYIRHQP